jgi:hypothetical protein
MNPPADAPYYLEYSYYILGDVHRKTVLDFGCGSGLTPLSPTLSFTKLRGKLRQAAAL